MSSLQMEVCSTFLKKFPTVDKVFKSYGADKWDYVLENITDAVNAPAPTLSQLDTIYGIKGAGKQLFINQLIGYYTMIERSGKPMNQQAADLAAKQFMGRYGKQCTTNMLLAYFASYSEFKGTLRDFDVEDIIKQFGTKFMPWWGQKINAYYKPKEPPKTDDNEPRGREGLVAHVKNCFKNGETENDLRDPDKHGLRRYGVLTDEIIQEAKTLAMETF